MPSRFGEMGPPKREGIRIRAVGARLPYALSVWRHGAAKPRGHTGRDRGSGGSVCPLGLVEAHCTVSQRTHRCSSLRMRTTFGSRVLPYALSVWQHVAAEARGHTDAGCFHMPSRFGKTRPPNREGIRMGTVCQIERACRAYPLEGSEVAWSLAEGSAALSHSPHPIACTAHRCVALACAVD